ncbi:butyryl-CoA dehydrogenase [Kribbella sp. VKM Ac-2527]|uniref:Butyryl-CoA dehydrogenase n=1 Tax=Kribbella caucasensis TaxID=2512215 RepID=A0A4R6KGX3_9ACTN|nr:acyl-CoA dehydrogenase family protein [Kribbella sp. VKM Ac-2527]TDO48719.1 butyryl-CoA dehydrogenase [Kribbella sp. VKM Ac-2527]
MPGLDLSDDQLELRTLAHKVAHDLFEHRALEWDEGRVPFPLDDRRRLGELGFLGIALPEQYGGGGAPILDALIVIEELAKVCRPAGFQVFEANTGPAQVVAQLGTERQKAKYLPAIIRGDSSMAVAISEPDAGSAATDMTTKAVREGEHFRVNGMKRWVSNAGHADLYLLYVRLTDEPGARGIGALIVEKDFDGVSFGAPEKLMGFRGIPSRDIYFDDVMVPAENLLVDAGGFRKLFNAFSIERLGNSTVSLSIAQAAVDRTIDYITTREQFGKPLIEFQAVQTELADMVVEVEAARLLVYRAAIEAGHGLPDPLQVSIAKRAANEAGKSASDKAIGLHGGNGYSEEYGIERLHRDAHGWAIAGGTPTMQKVRIVSELLGRKFDQRA